MNERIRELFEEKVFLNFVSGAHGLRRKPSGEYVSDMLEDHWQTFQEGVKLAVKECAAYKAFSADQDHKAMLNYFGVEE